MKAFRVLFCITLILIWAVFAGMNLYILRTGETTAREYRVQIARAAQDIAENGMDSVDFSKYPSILSIEKSDTADDPTFLEGGNADYLLREIDGTLYRFDYKAIGSSTHILLPANISLGMMAVLLIGILLYVHMQLLRPFNRLREMPYELSKGNLKPPVKEMKSQYFGRFLWGMDLLRERLEAQKAEELRLQKQKKTLILSITHDIKTPLSAIKLYAKALSRDLYQSREKQMEIAEKINARADDIERYISQISTASSEDFLNLQTETGEFYLSAVMDEIAAYYQEKLDSLKIDLNISSCSDCLIKGDKDRSVEVLQNVMENAIKYGNGGAVTITFSDEEDCRLVQITNENCTLSDNELPHIFNSFWRGANAETVKGNGLGLYICRQLMRKMDGDIFAQIQGNSITVSVIFRKV